MKNSSQLIGLKKKILLALFGTLAFLIMRILEIPIIPFAAYLKYEPSGAFILTAGLLFGPAGALWACMIKSILFFLLGGGNIFGVASDLIATVALACPAAWIGRKKDTWGSWMGGCAVGTVCSVLLMIPANYGILYLEFGMGPEAVTASMVGIIPFNLLKGVLNSILFLLLKEPVKKAVKEIGKG